MSRDNWIAVGGIVATMVMSVITLVLSWRMSRRPIQVILLTDSPTEKRAKYTLHRRLRSLLALSVSTAAVMGSWMVIRLASPAPVSKFDLVMFGLFPLGILYQVRVVRKVRRWRKQFREHLHEPMEK